MSARVSAFDRLAPVYAARWSETAVGLLQREAFLREVQPLFQAGEHILDLGCGTGDDALALARGGVRVRGIDSSAEMVRLARDRGADALHLAIENVGSLDARFDGAISNFGALNCVERLADLREPLAGLIRPGGWMALCLLNRFCVWETVWHGVRRRAAKATRRWRGKADGLGLPVYYPAARAVARFFHPHFRLERRIGIGVFVPPSYVKMQESSVRRLARADERLARLPGFRGAGDHQLFLFRRT
ncbi:MAG: class I SAM-dependent methyltransferase [Acidobacteriota bacterium]|nr:class I SAM-dependent methyltransferase [Acidobacteriota bacterium]